MRKNIFRKNIYIYMAIGHADWVFNFPGKDQTYIQKYYGGKQGNAISDILFLNVGTYN